MATGRDVGPLVLAGLDDVWERVRRRVTGLTQEEYRWEPVDACWSVREVDGTWRVDLVVPDPTPAPVTTIAWRLWHIGSSCLAGYTEQGLGGWPLAPLPAGGREWYGEVDTALAAVDTAWSAFRGGLERLGEDGMWRPLGAAWGPYAPQPWAALVLHAQDELSHHGAEIALLRDLYAGR